MVGIMARYGAPAIRGHGIPEAMEQVLKNESRISPRVTLLKPLSAAIAIGTGGPFGAEGPIIATGGALGSLLGQMLRDHRRRAQDAARRGRGGRHGGDVRHARSPPCCWRSSCCCSSTAPRSLMPVALASAGGDGDPDGAARRRRRCSRWPTSRSPARAAHRQPTSCSARVDRARSPRGSRGRSTRSRTRSSGCRSTGCGGRRSARVVVGVVGYVRAADAGRGLRQHRGRS